MVRHVGGHGLRDTPAKGRRETDRVDAEAQEAGADPLKCLKCLSLTSIHRDVPQLQKCRMWVFGCAEEVM